MRSLRRSLALVALMLTGVSHGQQAEAQAPGAGVGFRNDLKVPIIVQGVSIVNKMQRRGQPFVVQPGKTVWDNNLPPGDRFYTIYEATQQRVLLRNQQVRVVNVDQFFGVRPVPGGNGQIEMDKEAVPRP